MVLLGATTWWPLSARVAAAFIRSGCRVAAVCPPGHPLRFVAGIESLYTYRGLSSLASLSKAIHAVAPDVIVPCDDGVVWQLHQLHAENAGLRNIIEDSLGPAAAFSILHNRCSFLQTAAELGVRVPLTLSVDTGEDLAGWCNSESAVLKLDGTWGGSGVEIAHSQEELIAAYRRLARPAGASFAWKRFVVNRDPLALWLWRKGGKPGISIQRFIPGRPANTMFACWRGEVLGIVTVEVISAQGLTGAATVVRLIESEEISQAARLLSRRFNLHGFHGLDFILDQHTQAPYLIEINPRCTQLGHLRLPRQGDLVGAFAAKLRGQPPPVPEDTIKGETIAFFPQAFLWNPQSPYLHTGYHDVPWEETRLFHELLRDSWPDRQLMARLYHGFLRTPRRSPEVQFETLIPERTLN